MAVQVQPSAFRISPAESSSLLTAIRRFVQAYPLNPPPFYDHQQHLDPNERVGTVLLPLWQQNNVMNSNSPYWQIFLDLRRALELYLIACSITMRSIAPYEYFSALQVRDQVFSGQTDPNTPEHCFASFRLSANMTMDYNPLITTHLSLLAAVAAVGPFDYGDVYVADLAVLHHVVTYSAGRVTREGFLIAQTSLRLRNTPFVGEPYQFEFFMPC